MLRPLVRCTRLAPIAALLFALPPATASEKHDAPPSEAAKPAAKAPASAADPMDALRDKLAEKLGAAKQPAAANPGVVHVVAKTESAPAHAAKPRPVAVAPAAHRGEKPGAAPPAHDIHWSYAGAGGPENWGSLKPDFATCASGKRQSPIDIRGGIAVDLEPIKFDYRPSGFRVVDNGHTVQVDVGSGNSIEVTGRRYDLLQFHFHRPSEERIDGRQFDMVAHLVHRDPEGRLAVVAVLLDRGSVHPLVQQVWNNLPLEKGEAVAAGTPIDVSALLPKDRRYYTYMGSLTTPPCTEGVLWMVLMQPVPLATEQIGVFTRLYPMNARPTQAAAGRLIKQSN